MLHLLEVWMEQLTPRGDPAVLDDLCNAMGFRCRPVWLPTESIVARLLYIQQVMVSTFELFSPQERPFSLSVIVNDYAEAFWSLFQNLMQHPNTALSESDLRTWWSLQPWKATSSHRFSLGKILLSTLQPSLVRWALEGPLFKWSHIDQLIAFFEDVGWDPEDPVFGEGVWIISIRNGMALNQKTRRQGLSKTVLSKLQGMRLGPVPGIGKEWEGEEDKILLPSNSRYRAYVNMLPFKCYKKVLVGEDAYEAIATCLCPAYSVVVRPFASQPASVVKFRVSDVIPLEIHSVDPRQFGAFFTEGTGPFYPGLRFCVDQQTSENRIDLNPFLTCAEGIHVCATNDEAMLLSVPKCLPKNP